MILALLLALLQSGEGLRENLERHVRFLASDEMKGRNNGTPEGLRAAAYVADQLRDIGLKPGGREGYFHDFPTGRNVIGLLEGKNPKEFVVVAAHHEARGVVEGKIQNGADDNASGVAMVLELARLFAGTRPARSMLFISFDAEEDGLVGSREFVASGLYDPAAIAALFVFDLIGGNFFEWETDRLYALGAECSPELSARLARAEPEGLQVVRCAAAVLEPIPGMARSDYGPFRSKGVPFIFFSTGTPWYYHTDRDDADVINFGKMERAARFLRKLIAETTDDAVRPTVRTPAAGPEDVAVVRTALKEAIERAALKEGQLERLRALEEELSAMKEPEIAVLRKAMMLLFTVARSQGKP